jgi:hypothetical protein
MRTYPAHAIATLNRDPNDYAMAWKIARALSRKHGKFYSVRYETTGHDGWSTIGRYIAEEA